MSKTSQISSQPNPGPLIKSSWRDGAGHITLQQIRNNSIDANSGGHSLLEELEDLKREMNILVAKDA